MVVKVVDNKSWSMWRWRLLSNDSLLLNFELRWDCLESDLVLAGEEQQLEDMFYDAIQMIPEDRRYLSGQNELFETDAFDDVDFSCILGKVSVDSGIGSSTTNPVDHLLPRYVCRFSLSASPDEKLKLKLVS